ncbi:MAG: GNAT family N-acetyltransferase [Anaerobacillus sp.]|uniref:GNAT family N-acetyltransferase n=1 Tax=Anaerobacillus sp. TaxID=1872506 RepID=UPI00391B0FC7
MTLSIDNLQQMEIEYIKMFSEVSEDEQTLTFNNSNIPDMYTHNFDLYKSDVGLLEYIESQINKVETKAKGFFRIETYHPISADLIEKLSVKPQICTYDFMGIETRNYINLIGNPECSVLSAESSRVLEDGITVDIAVNEEGMGLDFATRRIKGKAEVYKNPDKAIELFVCYSGDTPIGNIEYIPFNRVAKFEDFDILEDYQRRSFGTSVLKHLLEKAFDNNIEHAYLITDQADTAKEMYKKNGFEKVGEKTELLFLF